MSEVASVAGSGSTPGPEGELDLPAHMPNVNVVVANSESNGGHSSSVSQHRLSPNSLLPAPTVRVEELRDDGGSNFVASDQEEAISCGSASDQEAPEFQPPDEELKNKIIAQVEFYFSDVNILKDAFLLKHVRRNKQGYVSLKLITSFKKLKSLTKDYRVVAWSLRQSVKLAVNEEGTKVRRRDPLPEWDETTPSRTVVAVNLPPENPTITNIGEIFSPCGEIALIRIVRPGKSIPQDVKKHIAKHPELGNAVCAVIEFEKHEHAKAACEKLTNTEDWRKGMRVVLLAQTKREDKEKKTVANKNHQKEAQNSAATAADSGGGGDLSPDASNPDQSTAERKKKNKRGKNKVRRNSRVEELAQDHDSSFNSSGSEAEGLTPPRTHSPQPPHATRSSLSPKPDPNRLSPSTTPRSSPRSSPRTSPKASPVGGRKKYGRSPLATESPLVSPKPSPCGSPETRRRNSGASDHSGSPSSPWVQRRNVWKAQQESPLVTGTSPGCSPLMSRRNDDGTSSPRMADMVGVLRQPRGPDGTRGFVGRDKPRSDTV